MENKKRILMVDDEVELHSIVKEYFKKVEGENCIIESCFNGKEAFDILKKERFDVMILDIRMPVMDGIQLLIELHNNKIWLPCIILTGIELKDTEKYNGKVYFFEKPFSIAELYNSIKEIFIKRCDLREISSITIPVILQLLMSMEKTGILLMECREKKGKLVLNKGKLMDMELENIDCGDFQNLKLKFIERDLFSYEFSEESKIKAKKNFEYLLNKLMSSEVEKDKKEVRMALTQEILNPILEIEGVEGVGIYISTGEVLVSATKPGCHIQGDAIGAFAIEMFKFSTRIMNELDLGTTNFFRIETDKKVFIHKCIEVGKSAIGVIADKSANIGLIIFNMDKVIERAKQEL